MVEATRGFAQNNHASVEEIQALAERFAELQQSLPEKTQGYANLILFFTGAITCLTGILLARSLLEVARKEMDRQRKKGPLSHRIRHISHVIEARLVPKIMPALRDLSPAQMAKVPEVMHLLFSDVIPEALRITAGLDEAPSVQDGAVQYKMAILQNLQALEVPKNIAPQTQIEAATSVRKIVSNVMQSRSDRPYRRIVSSAIDTALNDESLNPEIHEVLQAVKALML